jgi:hypothetical protein
MSISRVSCLSLRLLVLSCAPGRPGLTSLSRLPSLLRLLFLSGVPGVLLCPCPWYCFSAEVTVQGILKSSFSLDTLYRLETYVSVVMPLNLVTPETLRIFCYPDDTLGVEHVRTLLFYCRLWLAVLSRVRLCVCPMLLLLRLRQNLLLLQLLLCTRSLR